MSANASSTRAKQLLAGAPVISVITIDRASDAVPLARALVKGGLRVIEITLRTDAAMEAASAIISGVPDAIVGLGTVLTPADLARAERIGAAFDPMPMTMAEFGVFFKKDIANNLELVKVAKMPTQ